LFWRGAQHVWAGEMEDGERLLQRAADAKLTYASAGLAVIAARRGQRDEAVTKLATGLKALQLDLPEGIEFKLARGVYGDDAQRAEALALIEARAKSDSAHMPSVYLRTLLMMGEGQRALELSGAHITNNEASYVPLIWTPGVRDARRSPVFAEYARKTGMAALWDKYGPPDLCKRTAPGDYACE
jgi:hypothetical protein